MDRFYAVEDDIPRVEIDDDDGQIQRRGLRKLEGGRVRRQKVVLESGI